MCNQSTCTGASKFMDTITAVYGMYTELSLFSAYPLLSAYYLAVYIYRHMRLTTDVYGNFSGYLTRHKTMESSNAR